MRLNEPFYAKLSALFWILLLFNDLSIAHALTGETGVDRPTQKQLLKDLQSGCYTPSKVLLNVGRHVRPSIDPTGHLARLALVRLAKQIMNINNGNIPTRRKKMPELSGEEDEILIDLVTSLMNLTPTSPEVNDNLVEGTKAVSVLSRLIDLPGGVTNIMCDFLYDKDDILAASLEVHQLSGLEWAMSCFRQSHPACALPTKLQAAYSNANIPFRIIPGCFQSVEDLSVETLVEQVDFQVDDIRTTSNKMVKERRQTAWQGDDGVDPFVYAGKSMPRKPWSPLVRVIRDALQKEKHVNIYYDGCLLNLYPDGRSGMRYHSDPDQGITWDYETSVVSIGTSRRVAFRENCKVVSATPQPHSFVVMHGDVMHMFGDCQQRFQHTVKVADDKDETTARASLVFKRTLKV